jgi:hypothetical protein
VSDIRIPLIEWARRRYPVKTPSIHTLRRWAREARIVPAPEKHGREYFVQESAEYKSYQ